MPTNAIPAIIFTDLDGTLLDHHNYSFQAALPALRTVRSLGIPLILTTSKTLAEAREINLALENKQPLIVENGCAMCFPLNRDFPFEVGAHQEIDGHAVIRFSPGYAQIRHFIEQQRSGHHVQLTGFGDMSVTEVARQTGLGEREAAKAKQRLCSEPFVWLGSEQELARFQAAAKDEGLRITRGGRFWHLMGQTGKAPAVDAMRQLYTGENTAPIKTIALGDSENDREMLESVDIAVVVMRHDGTYLDCRGKERTLCTEQQGPAGWNTAVLQIIDGLESRGPQTKEE
ncbi:MAG: HAD-IIB family hydrolase [Sedimenticolaceae bacterium]